jgi:hypothetical protein
MRITRSASNHLTRTFSASPSSPRPHFSARNTSKVVQRTERVPALRIDSARLHPARVRTPRRPLAKIPVHRIRPPPPTILPLHAGALVRSTFRAWKPNALIAHAHVGALEVTAGPPASVSAHPKGSGGGAIVYALPLRRLLRAPSPAAEHHAAHRSPVAQTPAAAWLATTQHPYARMPARTHHAAHHAPRRPDFPAAWPTATP